MFNSTVGMMREAILPLAEMGITVESLPAQKSDWRKVILATNINPPGLEAVCELMARCQEFPSLEGALAEHGVVLLDLNSDSDSAQRKRA